MGKPICLGTHFDSCRMGDGPEALQNFIQQLGSTHDHIIFGEPHFNNIGTETYQFFANSPEIFEQAAENGVQHFFIEIPAEFQEQLDAFAEGEITAIELKQHLMDRYQIAQEHEIDKEEFIDGMVQTLRNAVDAGMEIHAADFTWDNLFNYPDLVAFNQRMLSEAAEAYEDEHGVEPDRFSLEFKEFAQEYFANLPEERKTELEEEANQIIRDMREQRLNDTEQYEYLKQQIENGEGVMGIVGLSHLNNPYGMDIPGIDDLLEQGPGSIATIGIYDNYASEQEMSEHQSSTHGTPQDPTDYTMYLDHGTVRDTQGQKVEIEPAQKPEITAPAPGAHTDQTTAPGTHGLY